MTASNPTIRPIPETLGSILTRLRALRRPVLNKLQAGLSEGALERLLSELPVEVPRDVRELYRTIDGTSISKGDVLDDIHFFPGFYFLSMEDAIRCYSALKGDERWRKSWFPLFANGGGDFYAVNCESVSQGEVVGFMPGEQDQVVEFERITSMMATIDACYSEGVFKVSKEGWLEADDAKQIDVARRFNPHLDLYK